jgi:hypothetical protein
LQRTEPDSSLRHKGVVEVPQFWQTGCNWGRLSSVNVLAMVEMGDQEEEEREMGEL